MTPPALFALLNGSSPHAFHWPAWHTPPTVAVGVALWAAGYLWVAGPLRERLGIPRPPDQGRRTVWFMAGLAAMFVALTGPAHVLSDWHLFTAHMVQVFLLTMIMAPLMVAGVPGWVVERALRARPVAAAARLLTRPLVAGSLYAVTVVAWHVPESFDFIVRHRPAHVAGHLSLMVAGVILWWPVLAPLERHRLPYLGRMAYLFLAGLVTKAVGAFVTLSEGVLYEVYPEGTRLFGLTPVADQQWGGLVMWVGMGLPMWLLITVLWFRWWAEEGDAPPPAPRSAAASGAE